ncbi:GH25 family lysozyme [Arthrobacter russicus]|uniref:GH25 family lysozyme n=1 Tax=Arthrobacter russicus TaxID=172040 RepID=UPI0031D54595
MNFKLRTSPSRISIALLTLAVLPALALGTGAAVAAPPLPEPSSTAAAEKSDQALPPEVPSPGAKMGWTEDSVVAPQLLKNAPVESGPRGAAAPQAVTGSTSFVPGWGVLGLDVSAWQAKVNPNGSRTDNVNWQAEWNQGARFAYVKATEGTSYKSDTFGQQYGSAAAVGMIRGAYHFALPSVSSGTQQANFFAANGGGWSADGITLPPLLDIEYNPYASLGDTCYNMAGTQMVNWIKEFSNRMMTLTGRYPVIYTTTDWWTRCTGNAAGFGNQALHVAAYNSVGPGTLPASWNQYSFWQYSDKGPTAGDSNIWNGDLAALKRFATVPDSAGNNAAAQIQQTYAQNSAVLGTNSSGIICGLRDNGCYQSFRGGEILWSDATGAQVSRLGAIRTSYRTLAAENGKLGYPTGPETCGLKNNGCYQGFQNGYINWTNSTGAQITGGAIRQAWAQTGYESGKLGYPTGPETCGLKDNGCYQAFQNGYINWTSSTGAQPSPNGPIRQAWAQTGYESGKLGYPISSVICNPAEDSCYQGFQNGYINWTNSTGAQITGGAIRQAWAQTGYESGKLGYPTGPETCGLKDNGCYQAFQNGYINWTNSTGAQPSPNGPIRQAWAQTGYESGKLGYPTGPETCGLKNNGCYQVFQGSSIYWTGATGAQITTGAIRDAWAKTGWEQGRLGYPVSGEGCNQNGTNCTQSFQGGRINWSVFEGISIN